ncbi:MAG: amino acid adenylation domain-containing protein [Candidatus Limivicinus sp.]|jgi:D-alanine--poly(phosphoribitol) ligase subunit 1
MKTVLEYLENSRKNHPKKTAVIDEHGDCSYDVLACKAEQIGTFLIPRIAGRQSVVCLMDKSVQCLQAFMGTAYAGCFYTLLDPSFPKERVDHILSVLTPGVIFTTHDYDSRVAELGLSDRVFYLEDVPEQEDTALLSERRKSICDTDPLYCNFTSGSTGIPKGVLVSHRSVIDFINVFTKTFGLNESDVFGNQAPFDFDVSVKDIYSSLCVGGTLVLLPKAYFMFPVKLVEMLQKYHVTTLIWAVSALCMVMRLHALKAVRPDAINKIMFSGEVMPIKQLNKWRDAYPDAMFVNLYGPTEITCNCTYYIVDREFSENDKIPMGIPFDNERVFLLDEDNHPAAEGSPGEICVAGTSVALGYYRNPEQTGKVFVQNPLQSDYPEIIYRTGDLAKVENGEMIFMGRKDFQIKHMGHRIELEEIEMVLGNVDGVTNACCAYDQKHNKIVGFYCGNVDRVTINDAMKKQVPDYMIPNVLKQMDQLPLTKNGKTDRKKLLNSYLEGR